MANDKLGNRKILNSAFDFTAPRRGSTEVYALNSAIPALANAIIEAADLYEADGRTVLLVDEELQIVTPTILAGAIRSNLVRKGLRKCREHGSAEMGTCVRAGRGQRGRAAAAAAG
jgi:hypothetical protein